MRTAGVVFAAGASRRMGKNKMLLELDGEPLVRRSAARAIAAGLSPVVVVVGFEKTRVGAALRGLDVTFAVNSSFEGPMSGSMHAAALTNAEGSHFASISTQTRESTERVVMDVRALRDPRAGG